jgi:hypothetical protein
VNQSVSVIDEDDEKLDHIYLTGPQAEFFNSPYKFPLFVAGFGSGKSLCMAMCAIKDLLTFPGANIACYAPTYDLLSLIIMQYLEESFINGNYIFTLNKGSHIFDIAGYGKIICRSMDNPGRIVGYETFRAHADELDILEETKADLAWKKIIARNRQKVYKRDDRGRRIPMLDENNEFVFKLDVQQFETELNRVSAYTTPEGFGFAYKRWVKLPDPLNQYKIYRASTYSNPYLPDDYVETLVASYPDELIAAYIEGEFVNLTSGRVYRKFDRELNGSTEVVEGLEKLYVGMDFNVESGACSIHVLREHESGVDALHAVDEVFNAYDTDDQIRILNEKYPDNPIEIYPDATGNKRASSNGSPSRTDLAKIRTAGFDVVVDYSNPLIKDRVNNVNAQICNGLQERHYFVNIDACPNLTDTLEQQIYDDNGVPDKKSGLDHLGDGMGYLITKMFPISRTNAGFLAAKRIGRSIN